MPLHSANPTPNRLQSGGQSAIAARRGIVTLFGHGIRVQVDRGHLVLDDGIGPERRCARFPRVGHGLERLVIIGSDGMISLAALRWLADQKASFVMLERDGSVLATTGPVRSSDARLRRAQACACQTELGTNIARKLISLKLVGQRRVLQEKLGNSSTALAVESLRENLPSAKTMEDIRTLEARAAAAYWKSWHAMPVQFPKKDSSKIPDHWLTFGSRSSPLSSFSPRMAVNPPNAILNYLYAVLESESRLALAELGLDPGIGFLHVDNDRRDSLACDLMEAIRPEVDAYIFDWLARVPVRREWFFEERNGNCRLMSELAIMLSQTAQTWRQAVAPVAEWLARTLWDNTPKMTGHRPPANRLTQGRRRSAQGGALELPKLRVVPAQNLCRTCGAPIAHHGVYCRICNAEASKKLYVDAANKGRVAALSSESQKKRKETQQRNARAQHGWIAAYHPAWLDQDTYVNRIQPRLAGLTASAIASAIHVSLGYADSIRKGKVHPHARHWGKVAELVGVSNN